MVPHLGWAPDVPVAVSVVPTCITPEPLVWSDPASWSGQEFHHYTTSNSFGKSLSGAPEMIEQAGMEEKSTTTAIKLVYYIIRYIVFCSIMLSVILKWDAYF